MKYFRLIFSVLLLSFFFTLTAQVQNAGTVRKRSEKESKEAFVNKEVSEKMQETLSPGVIHDSDITYTKEVYRQLDLDKVPNSALYYPEDVIDGQENLFRILFRLVVDGNLPAYEFLDGREIFSDQYRVNVDDLLSRFDIYTTEAKGSTEKNRKYIIEEADVPAGQVKSYYIIEKWEFDRLSNSMKMNVEAICPVLNKFGDYGEETKYPMFWVKMDSLRPYLLHQFVAVNDDNNLARFSLDDFFKMGLYDGEIYKIKNLRNLSMAQMYPDEDDRKRAQDSIDSHLRNYGKDLWVPSREEYLAKKESEKNGQQTEVNTEEIKEKPSSEKNSTSSRAKKKSVNSKRAKVKSSSNASAPEKSVRRRKK